MKIVVMFPCNVFHEEKLRKTAAAYDADVIFLHGTDSEKTRTQALQTADIIIGEPELADIHANKQLKWVQMTWAGTDRYTTRQAWEQDTMGEGFPKRVKLTNMSGAFGMIMSEYAIGAILSVYHRFSDYQRQQQSHIWQDAGSEECLFGKRLLLLGTGDIGFNVAMRAKAFGMHTVGLRRDAAKTLSCCDEMYGMEQLEQQLAMADIVVCSLPDKPNTRHLLTKPRLYLMKKDAVLLNMGRGSLLDCTELYEVLQSGQLRAAILDVTNPEPLPQNHPLWNCDRVMITPHVAGPSIGHCTKTQDLIVDACCDNIRRYFTKEPLLHMIEDSDFEYQRR